MYLQGDSPSTHPNQMWSLLLEDVHCNEHLVGYEEGESL